MNLNDREACFLFMNSVVLLLWVFSDLSKSSRTGGILAILDLVLLVLGGLGFVGLFVYAFFLYKWWMVLLSVVLAAIATAFFNLKVIRSPYLNFLISIGLLYIIFNK